MYQKAFSLIEMMMVLTMVTILTTVAVMSYQGYIVRAQLAEVFQLSGAYRTQFIASNEHCDAGRQIGNGSRYIEKVVINAACRIEFQLRQEGINAAIRGKSIAFEVYSGNCFSSNISQRYLPKDCIGQ
ncbi:prepilin-type N-terminal cleavage/methylation domain-containing protein [Acinetobacter bohemicus]|uniref:pilin n=1 Tax=Acinetobacter sp. S4397-1 TaxID=2972915 RepID=UPI00209AAE0E|nr:pilin [Acinetobacter sp. S4397-1]MCO8044209.1 prepilin-type N-terminal cleavage/methylation domain-containing protein [Acinetobacter sp. S4397-1]